MNAQQLLRDAHKFTKSCTQELEIVKYINVHISSIKPGLLRQYNDRLRPGEPRFDSRQGEEIFSSP
jgi:hypothetical protein